MKQITDQQYNEYLFLKNKFDEMKAKNAEAGKASRRNMTPEKASEIAKKAIKARWEKAKKYHTHDDSIL